MIAIVVWRIWRWEGGLLAGYAFLVLAETVLIRRASSRDHLNLELFWSWKAWSEQKGQITANIVMFVPIGVLVGMLWKWRGVIVAVGLSALIELAQLITERGLCEFDDVIHNTLGAAVGVGFALILKIIWKRRGINHGTNGL